MSTWFTGSLVSRWIISHSLSSMKRVAFIYFMLVSVYWLISYFPLYFSLFLENCPVRMELYKHLCLYTAGRRSWLIWKQEVFFFLSFCDPRGEETQAWRCNQGARPQEERDGLGPKVRLFGPGECFNAWDPEVVDSCLFHNPPSLSQGYSCQAMDVWRS